MRWARNDWGASKEESASDGDDFEDFTSQLHGSTGEVGSSSSPGGSPGHWRDSTNVTLTDTEKGWIRKECEEC
jgi:hypothetical protein